MSIQPDVFKLAKDGETRRKVCNDIGEINLDAWRESDPESEQYCFRCLFHEQSQRVKQNN